MPPSWTRPAISSGSTRNGGLEAWVLSGPAEPISMEPGIDELRDRYSREEDDTIREALARGPTSYTPAAWQVISEEAGRRGLTGVDAPLPFRPPEIDYPKLVPAGAVVLWVGIGAWLVQVAHYARLLRLVLVVGDPVVAPHPLPWGRHWWGPHFFGLVALFAGFQLLRSPLSGQGKVLVVVSLGVLFAQTLVIVLQ
jgi:hypothetical protein